MPTRRSIGMSRTEGGRRGAQARRTSIRRTSQKSLSGRGGSTRRMSREEAGRRGAESRGGREHYQSSRRGHGMTHEQAGERGGRAVLEEYGPEYFRELGRKGGRARWGEEEFEREGYGQRENRGRSHQQPQRAGRLGAEGRWGRDFEEEVERPTMRRSNRGISQQQPQSAGRLGSEARWGRDFEDEY